MVISYGIPHTVSLVLLERKMVVEFVNLVDFRDMSRVVLNFLTQRCRNMFFGGLLSLFAWSIVVSAQETGPKVVAEVLYLEANGHFNRGRYARAVEQYNTFLLKFPEHPKKINVQYGLGLSHFQ